MMKIILSICFSLLFFVNITSQTDDEKIVADVGAYKISLHQFMEAYDQFLESPGSKDNIIYRKSILNNLINGILLYYYDSNEKVFNDPKYIEELKENRVRTILAYLKDQDIYAKINVTEQEIREAFSRVNEKLAARHLFAKTEKEANNLYELLKIGVDFGTLAKQVFTDSVLQNNGGYLGYFTWGDMDPAFEDAAFSLKAGEISKPVKTAYGYSIIKLEDRISNPLLTESQFQNRKSHLESVIRLRKKDPAEKKYVKSIFDETKLKFNNDILKGILAKLNNKKEVEADNFNIMPQECVKYWDRIYSRAEIEQKISALPSYHRNKIISIETLQQAIKGILLNDTLYNIAKSKGYDTVQVVLERIDKYNMDTFLEHKMQEIVSKAQLPDSVVFSYYKKNISSFSTEPELNLQEILVNNEDMANSLLKLINDGADFGELAKKYSLRKWSANNNGIMGYAPVSRFGNYRDLFWNAKVGENIGPVKIEGIYGIFRVLGKEDSKPMDFNSIKGEVLKASQFENQTEIIKDYVKKIRSKVHIRIDENLLGPFNIDE
jgi:parvulin-like peptidyl-prolyl isomerase